MNKLKINMISSADKIDGQGVGSAYIEQVKLLNEGAKDIFEIMINKNKSADILHFHTFGLISFCKMKLSHGIKVAYVHLIPDTLDGSIKLFKLAEIIFKKYVVHFYRSADYLVVVNPIFIEELIKLGISKEKITYIPNFVSNETFYRKNEKAISNIRHTLNIETSDFVVLGAGQVQTRKGVHDFIECAKALPDIKFIWCGGFSFGRITDGYESLKEIMDNPPQNVTFTGIIPREKMNDLYNAADILFVPSYNELFPMTILEAIQSGKPLLLRNLELYKAILFDNYISADNNLSFINEIKKLHGDKEYYKTSVEKSYALAEFYSKDYVLKQWRKYYIDIYKMYYQNHS